MKKQICTYNPEVLVGLAQDFINAENDARIFYRKHRPFPGETDVSARLLIFLIQTPSQLKASQERGAFFLRIVASNGKPWYTVY